MLAKPGYAMTFTYHSSYENRREGDRIIQDANPADPQQPVQCLRLHAGHLPAGEPAAAARSRRRRKVAAPVPHAGAGRTGAGCAASKAEGERADAGTAAKSTTERQPAAQPERATAAAQREHGHSGADECP